MNRALMIASVTVLMVGPAFGSGSVLQLYYKGYPREKIVRTQNVAQVTNPSDGIYCVTPTNALPNRVYPQLTEVWTPFSASGSVNWQDPADDCNLGDIEVKTLYGGAPHANISFVLSVFN